MKTAKSRTFRAVLEKAGRPLYWVVVVLPFDTTKVWGTRARLKVKGTITGFLFVLPFFHNAAEATRCS